MMKKFNCFADHKLSIIQISLKAGLFIFFYLLLHVKVAKIHLCVKSNEKHHFLHSFTQFLVLLLCVVCVLLQ